MTKALLMITMLTLAACQPAPPNESKSSGADASAPREATVTSADGVTIRYQTRGQGPTALVFVHGWSCDLDYWRDQLDAFDDSYQVVTLDLAGHGESSADRPVWTVAGLGQDVVAVADALKLDQMILVGHSMGGPVTLAAAGAMPGRVLGVVGADTLHDASITYTPGEVGQAMAAFQADWAGSITGMFSGMSGQAMKPVLRDWIVAKAVAANPEVGVALFGDYARMDVPGLLAGAGVPVRVINAAAGGMTPETKVELNRQYADFDAVIMEGVGHFLQLEAPQAFNTALAAVLQEIEAGG